VFQHHCQLPDLYLTGIRFSASMKPSKRNGRKRQEQQQRDERSPGRFLTAWNVSLYPKSAEPTAKTRCRYAVPTMWCASAPAFFATSCDPEEFPFLGKKGVTGGGLRDKITLFC